MTREKIMRKARKSSSLCRQTNVTVVRTLSRVRTLSHRAQVLSLQYALLVLAHAIAAVM